MRRFGLFFTIFFCCVFLIPLFTHASLVNRTAVNRLNSGLIGYWTFDGGDLLTNAADRSGQGLSGYLQGFTSTSSAVTTGMIGQGLKFNGLNTYVSLGSSMNTTAVTYSAWVYPTAYPAATFFAGIVCRNDVSDSVFSCLDIRPDGKILWDVIANGEVFVNPGSNVLPLNQWSHVVLTYDSVSGLKGYVNGQLDASAAANGPLNTTVRETRIGNETGVNSVFFSGTIDDVRIYNRAISAAEVNTLYSLGSKSTLNKSYSNRSTNGLLAYWTFDGKDTLNGLIKDVSGNGKDGNLKNISTTTFYSAGKVGQGVLFDGVDDGITVNVPSTNGAVFSIAMWIMPINLTATYAVLLTQDSTKGFNIKNDRTLTYFDGGDHQTFTTLPLNTWTHVVLVSNGTTLTYYLNGVQDASPITFTPSTPLTFSTIGNDSGNELFGGKMDDVRVYNRALSAAEVNSLYTFGDRPFLVGASKPNRLNSGLVGYWTFDGKDTLTGAANDLSGNSNKGYFINIATSSFYTSGKIGQGIQFDGNDDYVTVPASSSINSLTSLTACAWIFPTVNPGSSSFFPQIIRKTNDAFSLGWDLYLLGTTPTTGPMGLGTSVTSDGANFTFIENRTGIVPMNTWSFVCTVQSGNVASNWTLYWNGNVVDYGGNSQNGGVHGNDSANSLRIGTGIGAGANATSYGKEDDVRLYNRALSQAEIIQLYNLGR